MNARQKTYELHDVERSQANDVLSAVFHTILFHRTIGKTTFRRDGGYSIGTVGFEDVACDSLDFTYCRVNSRKLQADVQDRLGAVVRRIRPPSSSSGASSPPNNNSVQCDCSVSIEFFERQPQSAFASLIAAAGSDSRAWEIWTLKLWTCEWPNQNARARARERLADRLADVVISIAVEMNRNEYVPKMTKDNLDLVFDTSFPDVQPYLHQFRVLSSQARQGSGGGGGGGTSSAAMVQSPSVGKMVRGLFKAVS